MGILVGILEISLKGTKILLCGFGLKLFSPLRGTLKQHIVSCNTLFLSNALKGTAKAPAVDLLRLKTLRGMIFYFFNPQ